MGGGGGGGEGIEGEKAWFGETCSIWQALTGQKSQLQSLPTATDEVEHGQFVSFNATFRFHPSI